MVLAGVAALAIGVAVLAWWWLGGSSAAPKPALAGGQAAAELKSATAQPADVPVAGPPKPMTTSMTAPVLGLAAEKTASPPVGSGTSRSSQAGESRLVAGKEPAVEAPVASALTGPAQQDQAALEIPSAHEESVTDQDEPAEPPAGNSGPFVRSDPLPAQPRPAAPPQVPVWQNVTKPPAGPVVLPRDIELTCVFFGQNGRVAIINGKPVEAGEAIEDVKVVSIGESSVEVEYQGRQFTVGLGSRSLGKTESDKQAEDKP